MKATKTTVKASDVGKGKYPENLPDDLIVYHAYVITNNFNITVPVLDDFECRQVRKYFTNAGIFYPWHGLQVLNYCRDKKKAEIKKRAKYLFPQMFKWGSGPNPIKYPEQLDKWGSFDTIIIVDIVDEIKAVVPQIVENELLLAVNKLRKESNMSNIVEGQASLSQTNKGITLENYKNATGKRFRLTKNEKALVESGQSTRERIFEMRKEQGTL